MIVSFRCGGAWSRDKSSEGCQRRALRLKLILDRIGVAVSERHAADQLLGRGNGQFLGDLASKPT
jgi:hypothetical protein